MRKSFRLRAQRGASSESPGLGSRTVDQEALRNWLREGRAQSVSFQEIREAEE